MASHQHILVHLFRHNIRGMRINLTLFYVHFTQLYKLEVVLFIVTITFFRKINIVSFRG